MRISLIILGILLIAGIWVAHRLRRRAAGTGVQDDPADWDDEGVHIRAGSHGLSRGDARQRTGYPSEHDPDPLVAPPDERAPAKVEADPDVDFGEPRIPGLDRQEPRLGVTFGDESSDLEPGQTRHADRATDIYGVLDSDEEPAPPPPHGATETLSGTRGDRSRPPARGGRRADGLRAVLDPLAGRLRKGLSRLRPTRAEDTLGARLDPEHEVDPGLIEDPDPPDMETLGEYVSEPRVVGENPRRDESPPLADEKILLLHVVAPRNRPFTGVALGAALERAGLQSGALDIYHYHDPQVDNRTPLFSVANMVAPGTLRAEDLADMMTPGVTLFVQVHASAQPREAFEAMLENAHALARDLGGSILDSQQSTATNQTLAYMREDLNQWLMRNRPDLLRRRSAR